MSRPFPVNCFSNSKKNCRLNASPIQWEKDIYFTYFISKPDLRYARASISLTGTNHKCLIRRIVGMASSLSHWDSFIFVATIREVTNVDFLTTGRWHKNKLRAFSSPCRIKLCSVLADSGTLTPYQNVIDIKAFTCMEVMACIENPYICDPFISTQSILVLC